MPKNGAQYVGLYGNTALNKQYCSKCRGYSFIRDNSLVCCGTKTELTTCESKRESEPTDKRRRLTQEQIDNIVQKQDFTCFYCSRTFGNLVFRNHKEKRLSVHIDHLVPHSYTQNQNTDNLVAACNICNMLKSSLIFRTVEEAKVYLNNQWSAKGFYD